MKFDRLAEEMGGQARDSLGEYAIDVPYKNWVVSLVQSFASTEPPSPGYARIVAEYITNDGFTFEVRRRGFVRRLFNRGAIQVGDAEIDREFAITGSDANKVKQLFANVKIRDLLRAQPSIHLRVKDREHLFGAIKIIPVAGDVVPLYFEERSAISDAERLRGLVQLFREILDRLVVLGSASEDHPGMKEFHDGARGRPDDADAHFRRGAANQGFGQSDRAMRDFDTVLQLNPDHAYAYFHRGLL
ncbi:MAG: tetratricopeptide repeat protein [Chloroflexi bacterium]|nr:tetratricopeptide repeat protein [Chloroflexota bacterium]